ncbi:amidohydrolase family protein [Coprothermobacteraceae bacterium]|nr:amidohydrolase family protein [Coprothermobacteraceae bacterium]
MKNSSFVDLHIHMWSFSLFSSFVDLSECKDLGEVHEVLRTNGLEGWHVGTRFNQEQISERIIPDRSTLDKWFPHSPAVLVRTCLHLMVLNTPAMEALNVYSPNGMFFESDVFELIQRVARKVHLNARDIVASGLKELERLGTERFVDMNVTRDTVEILGDYPFYTSELDLLQDALGLKIFLDGSLGARTAALTEPYSDDPDNYGFLNHTNDELLDMVKKAHAMDKPVALHAIGDRAIDQALRVLQQERHPLDRIEHLQITRLDQIEKLAELNVAACIQPIFSKELPWAEKRVGKRIETSYAWGLMKEYGVRLLAGTDAPVDSADPVEAADVVDSLSGVHHLDKGFVLALFREANPQFYGWPLN